LLSSLVGIIPGLTSVETGKDMSEHSLGYTRCFILNFQDQASLEAWAMHQAHPSDTVGAYG
jgi:Stress responsive A/B Barrel Domain